MIKILTNYEYIKDDPVRPSLSYAFRKSIGEIYYSGEENDPGAIVCVAMTTHVPKDTRDIALSKRGMFAIPYTVWSYKPKAGRKIIFALRDMAVQNGWKRLETLSPPTDMADRFHILNGAFLLNDHGATRNYEYPLCPQNA